MDEPRIDEIDEIYRALERGDAEAALETSLRGLEAEPGDPVLAFLAGNALLELDRAREAVPLLARAVEVDPGDVEFRIVLARALYHCGDTGRALDHARQALDAEPRSPDAHETMALLMEADERFEDADRHFERAAELDPVGFPLPRRLTVAAFEQIVREAGDRLPQRFRESLAEVAVTVEPAPSRELREAEQPPLDPGLLGLFVGVALPEKSFMSAGGELPPRIYLFQRNLERWAESREQLREEITVTLYHELGHYLGLDEDQLADLELD